jgi:hypothetical protein
MNSKSHTPGGGFATAGRRATALSCLIVGLATSGCGNSVYLVRVAQAEKSFEEAKELGAEQSAPYEYYSAEVRIAEAQRQAAQAEYGNAAHLSREARGYSILAIEKAKKSKAKEPASPKEMPQDPPGVTGAGTATSGNQTAAVPASVDLQKGTP